MHHRRVVEVKSSLNGVDTLEGVPNGQAAGQQPCTWCGRPITESGTGRRRRYCRRSCRQRAYEQRQALQARDLPEGTVVLSEVEARDLMDRMFQVRCSCEDLLTAITEGADAKELAGLAHHLVSAAREAERLR